MNNVQINGDTVTATISRLPDDLLLPGKKLNVASIGIKPVETQKKDVLIFIDNSKSAQFYLPTVKPLIAEFVRTITPDTSMVDAFSINTGVKNLLLEGNIEHDVSMINEMMYTEMQDEINPAEMFFTVNRFLEGKIEHSVGSRTTIVLFTFATNLMPNTEFPTISAEFNKLAQYTPVDLHVIGYGGFSKTTFLNMIAGLGSLTGSYQACVTDYEPERMKKEEPERIEEHKDDIRNDTAASLETLTKYLARSDPLYKVGLNSARMMNLSTVRTGDVDTGFVVLPDSSIVVVEHGTNTYGVNVVVVDLRPRDFKYAILMSIKGVLANFDRYGTEKKLEALFKTLMSHKDKGAFYTKFVPDIARDGRLQSALQLLASLLIEQISGGGANGREFARVATRCSRMLVDL